MRRQPLLHLEERRDGDLLARTVRRRSNLRVEDADVGHRLLINVYREALYAPQEGYAPLPHDVTGPVPIVEQRVILPLRYDALRLDHLSVEKFLHRRPAVDGAARHPPPIDVAALSDETVLVADVLRRAFFLV